MHHVTSAYVDSSNALTVTVSRPKNKNLPAKMTRDIAYYDSLIYSKLCDRFGEGFEFPIGNYDIVLATTATDIVILAITLQKIGD